jgi:hypothetical protein
MLGNLINKCITKYINFVYTITLFIMRPGIIVATWCNSYLQMLVTCFTSQAFFKWLCLAALMCISNFSFWTYTLLLVLNKQFKICLVNRYTRPFIIFYRFFTLLFINLFWGIYNKFQQYVIISFNCRTPIMPHSDERYNAIELSF